MKNHAHLFRMIISTVAFLPQIVLRSMSPCDDR